MFKRLSAAFGLLLIGAVSFAAPATPAAAFDVGSIATSGVSDLTALVTAALPYIVAAIGLGIVLRWGRRLFKF